MPEKQRILPGTVVPNGDNGWTYTIVLEGVSAQFIQSSYFYATCAEAKAAMRAAVALANKWLTQDRHQYLLRSQ